MTNKIKYIIVLFLILLVQLTYAQKKAIITGVLKDAETSEPLIGATVVIDGQTIGTVTDFDGKYRLVSVPLGQIVLVADYLGYTQEKKEITTNAGDQLEVDFNLGVVAMTVETVVVTAQAQGQISAINRQRSANTIVNIISAKKIQEVPDANAAETLGRLPGVSIQRNGGEGSKVVIRGMAPKFNKIQVEGVKMASTGGDDRSSDLSMISPYMLEAIEVSKAAMPDKEGDVFGGSVNFVLREAPKEKRFDVLLQGSTNTLNKSFNNYKLVLGGSRRFGNDKFGIFAQIDLDRRNRSSYEVFASYDLLDVPTNLDDIIVNLGKLSVQDIQRDNKRAGATVVLDYKLKNGSFKFSNFYSSIGNDVLNRSEKFIMGNAQHDYILSKTNTKLGVYTSALKFKKAFGSFNLNVGVSYTGSNNDLPSGIDLNASEGNAFDEGLERESHPSNFLKFARNNTSEAPVTRINKNTFSTSENEIAAGIDLDYTINFSKSLNIKFKTGVKAKKLNKEFEKEVLTIPVAWSGHGTPFVNKVKETYPKLDDGASDLSYSYFVDETYDKKVFPNSDYYIQNVPDIKFTEEIATLADDFYFRHSIASEKDDYSGFEDYKAGYIMGYINIGKKLSIIPGVRYENNKTTYTANRGDESSSEWDKNYFYHDTTIVRENAHFLPMIHLKYKPVKWFDIRAAYTRTLARPSFNEIVPKWNIKIFNVDWNNPFLVPSVSENFDIYLSFFKNKLGLLTIGGFSKEITDLIYNTGSVVIIDPEKYGLESNTKGRSLTQIINNQFPAKLFGMEIEWQTRFWYMENFLKGVVLNLNYTRTISDVNYPVTRVEKIFTQEPPYVDVVTVESSYQDRLIYQPSDIFNITVGYDYKGFSSRLSFLYQNDIFSSTNFYEKFRGSSDEYYRFDFNLRQKLPWKGFEVLANFSNLTSAVEREINNGTGYPTKLQYYGTTIDLGIRYRL